MKIINEYRRMALPVITIRFELAPREAKQLVEDLEGATQPVLKGLRQAAHAAYEATRELKL